MEGWDRLLYIAGPFSDPDRIHGVEQNILQASRAALDAWREGWVAVCPHKNTAGFQHVADLPYKVWTRGDLAILSRCDAILLLPDWPGSPGARREVIFAVDHGIPVLSYYPGAEAGKRKIFPAPNPEAIARYARELEVQDGPAPQVEGRATAGASP